MDIKQGIIDAYQYISRRVDNRPTWKFEPTDRQDAMLDTFIRLLDKEYGLRSIGKKFITNYLAYQYLRWFEKDDTRFGKTVMLSWLIGEKAFERWKTKSEGWSHVVRVKILIPYDIDADTIFIPDTKKFDCNDLLDHEESIKERFRKDENLLGHCAMNTTLYNRRSKWCVVCRHKRVCKDTLKQMYPSIYIQRGYAAKD